MLDNLFAFLTSSNHKSVDILADFVLLEAVIESILTLFAFLTYSGQSKPEISMGRNKVAAICCLL